MLRAGRYHDTLALVDIGGVPFWSVHKFGCRALCALGWTDEAIRYAEAYEPRGGERGLIARECETILLEAGRRDEAYDRYALEANVGNTNLNTLRAILRKYPEKEPAAVLADLVEDNPGAEGKWFAAARSVGAYAFALELANRSPADPRTLLRAARDHGSDEPQFAYGCAVTALRWIVYGTPSEWDGSDLHAAIYLAVSVAGDIGMQADLAARLRQFREHDTQGYVSLYIDRLVKEYGPPQPG